MALEELSTTVSKLTFNIFGSESEKRLGGFLFDERKDWATSRELHGLAALTFNEKECAGVMAVIAKALNPKDSTWRTLNKAVKLLQHFVLYGAERCVDHAWDQQRRVEELRRYNSAMHGRTSVLNGGGTDFGGPVREAAAELDDLLKNSDAIREARDEGRTPDALLPLGAPDDYKAPAKPKEIDLGIDDAFGIVPQGSMGAKFDLKHVPGLYEGRPDRYFDNTSDPRRRTQEIEDSDYTRQAQAVDLLDLDIGGETQAGSVPEAQDLMRSGKEAALAEQLRAQQQQLEQLRVLMLSKAQAGGVAGGAGGVALAGGAPAGAPGGAGAGNLMSNLAGLGGGGGGGRLGVGGAVAGVGLGGQTRGRGQAQTQGQAVDKVTDAFSSLGLDGGSVGGGVGPGGAGSLGMTGAAWGGGGGAMAQQMPQQMSQQMPQQMPQQMLQQQQQLQQLQVREQMQKLQFLQQQLQMQQQQQQQHQPGMADGGGGGVMPMPVGMGMMMGGGGGGAGQPSVQSGGLNMQQQQQRQQFPPQR